MLRLVFIFGNPLGFVREGSFFMPIFTLHTLCTPLHTPCSPENLKNAKIQAEGRRCELFQNNPYFQSAMPQNTAFQRQAYQPQQMYQQPMPQPVMQDNTPQVRFVASREEAYAATVFPGIPCVFYNRTADELYYKSIDPQSGISDFRDYSRKQPEQTPEPQFATADDLAALEQRIEQRIASMQAKATPRKAVTANDE